jgi:hypothetical protein
MIGGGILEVSQELMIEALQEWLDKRWTVDSPCVTAVTVEDKYRHGGLNPEWQPTSFRVGLKSNKQVLGVEEARP